MKSYKRDHKRCFLHTIKFQNSGFGIGETIWWIRTLLPNETDSFRFINLEFLLLFLDEESILFLSRAIAIEFSSGTCRLERLLSLCRCGAISGVTARGRFWLTSFLSLFDHFRIFIMLNYSKWVFLSSSIYLYEKFY